MKTKNALIALALLFLTTNCAPKPPEVPQERETLYQISTYQSLAAGNYAGFETVGGVKEQGDLGIGTFDGLEGEMIVIDGLVYQALIGGQVAQPAANTKVPFASVTRFDADLTREIKNVENMDALKIELDGLRDEQENFYAIRIDGVFSAVQVRTVPKQAQPYPSLTEAIKNQEVTERENVKGTAVGFWSPEYVGGILVPGYHLHFISDDRKLAGHLLDCTLSAGIASLDKTPTLHLTLDTAAE